MESKALSSECFKLIALAFPQIGTVTFGKGYEKRLFNMRDFRLKLGTLTPVYWITETFRYLDNNLMNEIRGRPRPSIVLSNRSKPFEELKEALVIFWTQIS